MAKVLLDTNFIMNCVRESFDFFEEIFMMGHRIVVPEEVVLEIQRLSKVSKTKKDKDVAILSLRILAVNDFEKVNCPGKYVDKGIIDFLKNRPEYILATYDKELKKKISNRILVLRGKKKLEIVWFLIF